MRREISLGENQPPKAIGADLGAQQSSGRVRGEGGCFAGAMFVQGLAGSCKTGQDSPGAFRGRGSGMGHAWSSRAGAGALPGVTAATSMGVSAPRAPVNAPLEAGRGQWCGGSSQGEGGMVAEGAWGMTNRLGVLKTHQCTALGRKGETPRCLGGFTRVWDKAEL